MRTFTRSEVVAQCDTERRALGSSISPAMVLAKESRGAPTTMLYDIFLSHAYRDAEQVLGLRKILKGMGISVYVDWIDDAQLSRDHVTASTAARLRQRMKQCQSLLYVTSDSAPLSRWMPWEAGYFDAYRARVAILPVTEVEKTTYQGQEYLGLYPYVLRGVPPITASSSLWVKLLDGRSVMFKDWINPGQNTLS